MSSLRRLVSHYEFSHRFRRRTSKLPFLVLVLFGLVVTADSPLQADDEPPTSGSDEIADTKFFTTSGRCAICHSSAPNATALRDAQGRSVAPSDLWPSSMMANSTVDPLWRAVVAAEVAATPSRKAEIEAKCLRCHAPMASVEAEIGNIAPSREEFLHGKSTLTKLAADGVSCAACHQIPPEGVGTDETFTGQFQIGREGKIFGPHAKPFAMPMYRHTGYVPTESAHVRTSALCASCHTLFTDSLNPDGTATGHMLLEQGPYVEWQNSAYNNEVSKPTKLAASCQDCHMPTSDLDGNPIKTRIARNPHGRDFPPVRPREPFGRHSFVGANTLMLSILRDQHKTSGQPSRVAGFNAAIKETRTVLREKTAQVQIAEVTRQNEKLNISVKVKNLVGHKLPTAYPSRRVWIRLLVRNAEGAVVFSSGQFDDRGRLIDAADRVLPSEKPAGPIQMHRQRIASDSAVQIYEAVMENAKGTPTFSLLRGARYHKDNRLLPKGWKRDHERGPMTAPTGTAADANFHDGEDEVTYVVDAPLTHQPYRIEATLHYQTLGARYAEELFRHDVPEMKHFQSLYGSADAKPELLGQDVRTVAE